MIFLAKKNSANSRVGCWLTKDCKRDILHCSTDTFAVAVLKIKEQF